MKLQATVVGALLSVAAAAPIEAPIEGPYEPIADPIIEPIGTPTPLPIDRFPIDEPLRRPSWGPLTADEKTEAQRREVEFSPSEEIPSGESLNLPAGYDHIDEGPTWVNPTITEDRKLRARRAARPQYREKVARQEIDFTLPTVDQMLSSGSSNWPTSGDAGAKFDLVRRVRIPGPMEEIPPYETPRPGWVPPKIGIPIEELDEREVPDAATQDIPAYYTPRPGWNPPVIGIPIAEPVEERSNSDESLKRNPHKLKKGPAAVNPTPTPTPSDANPDWPSWYGLGPVILPDEDKEPVDDTTVTRRAVPPPGWGWNNIIYDDDVVAPRDEPDFWGVGPVRLPNGFGDDEPSSGEPVDDTTVTRRMRRGRRAASAHIAEPIEPIEPIEQEPEALGPETRVKESAPIRRAPQDDDLDFTPPPLPQDWVVPELFVGGELNSRDAKA